MAMYSNLSDIRDDQNARWLQWKVDHNRNTITTTDLTRQINLSIRKVSSELAAAAASEFKKSSQVQQGLLLSTTQVWSAHLNSFRSSRRNSWQSSSKWDEKTSISDVTSLQCFAWLPMHSKSKTQQSLTGHIIQKYQSVSFRVHCWPPHFVDHWHFGSVDSDTAVWWNL